MSSATVFDIRIDDVTLDQVLKHVENHIKASASGYIATVNSELLLLSRVANYKQALEQADLRLCDGIGVQWAAAFTQHDHARIVNLIRWPFSLLNLLIHPQSAERVIRNRLSGRILFEDLLAYCAERGHSVYFLGAGPGVAEQVARQAQARHPQLKVAGYYAGNPDNAADIIAQLKPSQVMFVAYGSPRQELFLNQNITKLKTNLAVGVGGTFDNFVGTKPIGSVFRQIPPPDWVHRWGLESLWRLITQPNRFRRVWRSTVGFSAKVAGAKKQ